MSFEARAEKVRKEKEAVLALPCTRPEDQAVHDRLVRFDRLHKEEGHTLMCAARQVSGETCTCADPERPKPLKEGESPCSSSKTRTSTWKY